LRYKNVHRPRVKKRISTVVDMATITNHAIDKLLDIVGAEIINFTNDLDKTQNKVIEILNNENRYNRLANILHTENYIVPHKEIVRRHPK